MDKKTKEKTDKEAALAKLKPNALKAKTLRQEITALGKDIDKLSGEIAELDKQIEKFKDWVAKLTDLKVKMQGLINATNLITAKLNTPDESSKLTALSQLLRAERLHAILKDSSAYTLHVAANANGTTKIKKNLFVDAKVRHSAGANLVYQLFNNDGVVAQGGALQCYIDYQSARNVRDFASGIGKVVCGFPSDAPGGGSNSKVANHTAAVGKKSP